ncbi:PTS cellobiose transporter subunit IIC [Bacillus gobiensis]|uniref:PTS cellobiose transporter subunit IIC n=1 Tax=Bacillus gobiensis TaxID=1441095 RepID=UPI003D24FE1F
MNKVNLFLENRVMPIAGRIAGQRHLLALRDGIVLTMPLIIVGSLFLILSNLPIPAYLDMMARLFGDEWSVKLSYPVGVTFDIMALVACFGIAYRLAERYEVDALSSGAIAVAAFLLATPYEVPFLQEGSDTPIMVDGGIPVVLMGSQGLFVAMIIALFSTEVFRFVIKRNIVIKMPDGVPPAVSRSFIALIPGFLIITIIWILRLIVEQTSFGNLHNVVGDVLGQPMSVLGGSLIGSLIAILIMMLLWACGLHGSNIVLAGIMAPVYYAAMDENRLAFQSGEELPNVFTLQFFEVWINVGGSGATLALVVAMVIFAKSQQMKSLGRLAVGPAFFNINEPIIFGMPIVMNPLLLIPFIFTPLVTIVTTYIGMSTGLVAKPAGIAVPWTMPPIVSGYLATGGSISGAVLQVFNFAISLAIYYPFLKMWDKQKVKEENASEETSDISVEKTQEERVM